MSIPGTALVLGGGGITGIAWEIGMLAGLAGAGLDLTEAETVVGTSAGSVVGAQVAGGDDLEELYAHQLRDATGEPAASLGKSTLLRFVTYQVLPGGARARRARLGRAALRADAGDESARIQVFRDGIGEHEWPPKRLLVTAVDAMSGEFRVFDKHSGVDLVRAVAASCAVPLVWPPVSLDGRRYVDGGIRSPANADLARGARKLVVLAPIATALHRSSRVRRQVELLGAHVRSAVVSPDRAALRAIGTDVLDPARRAAAARAGRDQAGPAFERVRSAWAG